MEAFYKTEYGDPLSADCYWDDCDNCMLPDCNCLCHVTFIELETLHVGE